MDLGVCNDYAPGPGCGIPDAAAAGTCLIIAASYPAPARTPAKLVRGLRPAEDAPRTCRACSFATARTGRHDGVYGASAERKGGVAQRGQGRGVHAGLDGAEGGPRSARL